MEFKTEHHRHKERNGHHGQYYYQYNVSLSRSKKPTAPANTLSRVSPTTTPPCFGWGRESLTISKAHREGTTLIASNHTPRGTPSR